jgi:enoyl-CoA hydratase
MNALNTQMLEELRNLIETLSRDPGVRVLVLGGMGKVFCVGADILEVRALRTSIEGLGFVKKIHNVFNALERMPKPTIAAVEGLAYGGGFELALCCDMRITAEEAKWGLPEVRLGLMPGGGGTQRLPALVGLAKAKEMIFTGKTISAKEAFSLGLVNEVVAGGDVLGRSEKLAEELVLQPPLALAMAKEALNAARPQDSGMKREIHCVSLLFSTEDREEGLAAFLEKRKALFKGR